MRVSFLERALKPAKRAVLLRDELNDKRERAEEDARHKAMTEFYRRRKIERYLRNPSWLAADLAYEKEIADYLKSRGLKPPPSSIPEQFHAA